MPFFSVIVPTHNGEARIRQSLHSVKIQTFKDYELIVVCDNCVDNTSQIALGYADKTLIRNFGRDGLARNAGLDAAEGEWILFLDDDDYFLHEYCFEQLAQTIRKTKSDVVDFSFVWKGEGYKVPTPDEQFVMAWCRAWKRSFVGTNRFDDAPYGSDKHFYEKMIQNNPDVTVTFWNMPMYYYNYMREGSLSWMEKNRPILEIVVTHYNEPWKLGKPFFDMLENQRLADMDRVRVTLVQDGKENELQWEPLLEQYSFPVSVLTVPEHHDSAAHARNVALSKTEADWIMFFNFDDRFGDVCALSMIMEQFPTDDADVIWCKVVQEQRWYTGTVYMNCIDGGNFANTDGKIYRTSFLRENRIYFPMQSRYYYDHIFNSLVLACADPWRIASLTTNFYPIYKTFRSDSLRHTEDACNEMVHTVFERDCLIASLLSDKSLQHQYRRTVAKAVFGQYYALYDPETQVKGLHFPTELIDYYGKHQAMIKSILPADIDPIRSEAEIETMNAIQTCYNEHKKEYYLMNDDVPFYEWLSMLDAEATGRSMPQLPETPVEEPHAEPQEEPDLHIADKEKRVVVYCGTYDVYMNMVASCKSLLATTPVDAVYFLIEDDEFPGDLPEIVHTINIKPLANELFSKDGPNYNNAWTYMCMIRAAFPDIFARHDRILSLDVDVVVNDNVSDLWDYDLSDYYLAGVPERQRQKSSSDPLYINFGVVMMNLAKLRQDGLQPKLIEALNKQKFGCPEQDCYNRFCAGHILDLPNDYNFTTYSHITGDAQKERIIHYAGQRFWRHYAMVKKYADMTWEQVMERQRELK